MGQRFPSIYLTEARGRPDEGERERGAEVWEMKWMGWGPRKGAVL